MNNPMDTKRPWPSHMAPPHMKSGALVEDEKLLMRALRTINRVAPRKGLDEFARLYEVVTASYLLNLEKLRSSTTEDN